MCAQLVKLDEYVRQCVVNAVEERVIVKVETTSKFPYGEINFLFADKQTGKQFTVSVDGSEVQVRGLQVLDELVYRALKQLGFEDPRSYPSPS